MSPGRGSKGVHSVAVLMHGCLSSLQQMNSMSIDEEKRKLALVIETARDVWGA